MGYLSPNQGSFERLARFRAQLGAQNGGDPNTSILGCGHRQPAQNVQVVGYDRAPDILLKTLPSLVGASSQSKGPLEPRNRSLNACTEVAKPTIDPMAFDHIQYGEPSSFAKHDVFDPPRFGPSKIIHRSKSPIGCHLTRHAPVKALLTAEKLRKHARVFGI